MTIPFTNKTLGELLNYKDEIIRRNSMSILKRLQRAQDEIEKYCDYPHCNELNAVGGKCLEHYQEVSNNK